MTRSTRARWFGMTVALATLGAMPVWAQSQPAATPAPTSVGPGRIICTATFCEMRARTDILPPLIVEVPR